MAHTKCRLEVWGATAKIAVIAHCVWKLIMRAHKKEKEKAQGGNHKESKECNMKRNWGNTLVPAVWE